MSILKYFKPLPKSSSNTDLSEKLQLPDLRGPLSVHVSSSAIEAANRQVADVLTVPKASGPYGKLIDAQRYEVRKRAAEYGIAASVRYFSKKFPDLSFKETTV